MCLRRKIEKVPKSTGVSKLDNNKALVKAKREYLKNKEIVFLFKFDRKLHRAKVLKGGSIRIKTICTGVPTLISLKNKGSNDNPEWFYKFKVKYKDNKKAKILLSSKDIRSNYKFKSAILNQGLPVLFTGSPDDFNMYISNQHDRIDYTKYD